MEGKVVVNMLGEVSNANTYISRQIHTPTIIHYHSIILGQIYFLPSLMYHNRAWNCDKPAERFLSLLKRTSWQQRSSTRRRRGA